MAPGSFTCALLLWGGGQELRASTVGGGENTMCCGTNRTPSRKVVGCFPFFVVSSITAHVVGFSRAAHLGGGSLLVAQTTMFVLKPP